MKKSIICFFAVSFVAISSLFSCSKDILEDEAPANGYNISIPVQSTLTKAVNENGVSSFKTTENVYLYNLKTNTLETAVLHPNNDAAKTHFYGSLTMQNYTIGDDLQVLYNTNSSGIVDYSAQDGSINNVVDAGTGTVAISNISGNNITTTGTALVNLQSIFKFTFQCGGTPISGIRFVRIFSTQNKLAKKCNAITSTTTEYGPVTVSRDNDLDVIYAGLRFDTNDGDEIVFQVVDKDGKVYSGSKAAPAAGFEIGKFYDTTVDVNLYTFKVSSSLSVCFSPGDLGVEKINNQNVYSFTEPFAAWSQTKADMTNNTAPDRRTWFIRSEVENGQSVCGIDWRIQTYNGEWKYLVGINAGRTIDRGKVSLYYKVHINTTEFGDRYWCLLLPPDEATFKNDIKDDLQSYKSDTEKYYEVTDYLKYIAKGFVLLIDSDYSYKNSTNAKWSFKENKHEGVYWASYVSTGKNYFHFGTDLLEMSTSTAGSDSRLHTRYIHNVTLE